MGYGTMTPMELTMWVYLDGSEEERKSRIHMLQKGIRCHEKAKKLEARSKKLIGRLVRELRSVDEDADNE